MAKQRRTRRYPRSGFLEFYNTFPGSSGAPDLIGYESKAEWKQKVRKKGSVDTVPGVRLG